MGLTKTEIFTKEQNELSTLLKAIAHPARIAILQQIISANACICGDLGRGTRTCASHHFAAFKRAEECGHHSGYYRWRKDLLLHRTQKLGTTGVATWQFPWLL